MIKLQLPPAPTRLTKILIANRGEIAVRIIRTCRDMGLATVAVYSESDRMSLHVRLAEEAYAIGPDQASESYLRIEKLIDVARTAGADAVHPGYGFLAENPEFAGACLRAGLTFVGPDVESMRTMGSKTGARAVATRAGVPVVPGTDTPFSGNASDADLRAAAAPVGYPLLVKAVAGGGGKGMRIVGTPRDLSGAVRMARSEALSSFGDERVYFERLLDKARHIEVQILGDHHGTVVPFVERECSIQRRHQKLIEETPSPAASPELRARLMAAATAIGKAAAYRNAGTIEFLVDRGGGFYFLEMNTRLQVEHPITEAVTGVDFVRAQIEIAQGARLEQMAAPMPARGHAIEVRVYAENPDDGFMPSPGLITHLRVPGGPGIRDDTGAFEGWTVPTAYDPLISKVVAWAPDRQGAIRRMVRALEEYDVRGISTTIGFCRDVIASRAFGAGEFDTTFVDRLLEERVRADSSSSEEKEEIAAIAAALWKMARPKSILTDRSGPQVTTGGTGASSPDGDTEVERTVNRTESLWLQRARWESLR
jgi:acetyl-CoA carboxylase biotin carboxylase subunit